MSALESTTVAQYFQRALEDKHTRPVLAFPKKPEGFSDFKRYPLAELKSLADAAAAWYIANGIHVRKQGQTPLVVALCTRGDIDWMAAYFSLLRMGHTVFGLSLSRVHPATR
jgi:acyl-CoA synthetase (AMP-forming)/AMP-acid ligase II